MMRALFFLLCLGVAQPVWANTQQAATGDGMGAVLRLLDKVSGDVIDLEQGVGQTVGYGTLEIHLGACRYPLKNPTGDAFAYLEIVDLRRLRGIYNGWMVASSPALNPLDHSRYDVWVLRCLRTSDQ